MVAALKRFAPPAGFFAALRMTSRFEDTLRAIESRMNADRHGFDPGLAVSRRG
jgi:hypothetical protein